MQGNEFTAARRSTAGVIGCGIEWQLPYVPEQLCGGYNNKTFCVRERWQIKIKKTTGIKSASYHITWFSGKKLPPPPSLLIFILVLFLLSFALTSTRPDHVNPLKIPLRPKGGVEAARCFHVPSSPLRLFIFVRLFVSPPQQVSFTLSCRSCQFCVV